MRTGDLVRPLNQQQLPTTAAAIFVRNLRAQIASAGRILANSPTAVARKQLAQLRKVSADCRDDIDEYQEAIDLLSEPGVGSPIDDPEVPLLRAQLQLSLHRLAHARADLDRARSLGANALAVSAIQIELDWNAGRYEAAVLAIRRTAASHPSTHSLARLAELEHRLGRGDAACDRYAEAEECIRDTLPLTVAWLNVQRGAHAVETGNLPQAILFVEEAVRRLPQYLAARALLAKIRHESGEHDESLRVYDDLAAESANPEHWSDAISVYATCGLEARRDAVMIRARAAWERLLLRYPEAMYWHAAEFCRDHLGDPTRAVELLQRNATLRPNADSWLALAEAQEACGDAVSAERTRAMAEEARMRLMQADA